MLLTVTTTHRPATDLGFLLHKHPDKAQSFDTAVGAAHVFYPEAGEQRCTVALLLDVDPVGLARSRGSRTGGPPGQHAQAHSRQGGEAPALGQYVDDRPYSASSLLAVALAKVFSTAMSGRCKARPDLVDAKLPLEIRVPALPCRGPGDLVERLFGPLGWDVEAVVAPLDPAFPDWGGSPYRDVTMTGTMPLADALTQLYVLLPVLDDGKHYRVGQDEVDKLLREAAAWLPSHPERDLVTRRYLAHRRALSRSALARLAEVDDTPEEEVDNATDPGVLMGSGVGTDVAATGPPGDVVGVASDADAVASAVTTVVDTDDERPVPLAEQRRGAVLAVLRSVGARRVADVGCGDGKLVAALLADPAFTDVVAADVSHRALELAARRLRLDRMPDRQRERLRLVTSSLVYRDAQLAGLDALVLSEVVEHVDPPRLPALAEVVFGHARPGSVVVTTPNVEYNVRYEGLAPGALRHRDHRFEWTRAEFAAWADGISAAYGYPVRLSGVGAEDPEVGPPSQLAVFTRGDNAGSERGDSVRSEGTPR